MSGASPISRLVYLLITRRFWIWTLFCISLKALTTTLCRCKPFSTYVVPFLMGNNSFFLKVKNAYWLSRHCPSALLFSSSAFFMFITITFLPSWISLFYRFLSLLLFGFAFVLWGFSNFVFFFWSVLYGLTAGDFLFWPVLMVDFVGVLAASPNGIFFLGV